MVVRPEWSSYAAPAAPAAPAPEAHQPPSPEAAPVPPAPGVPTRAQRLASEPTDELFPGRTQRDPTLKFEHGAGVPAPVVPPVHPPVRTPERGARRWPWVLITLLPIIVIVGSGIWLFILLSHA